MQDQRSGLLVDSHDPEDYARAMRRIVAEPGFRDELSRGALLHAQDFAWERTAERTIEVYRQAVRAMRDDLARVAG